ncbi:MAG TPA: site-specific integrase [Candidatus Kapabacteria bacterium]|nr:site-specific integrase [Candidatus Kapabacteria bacterium]
MSIPVRKKKLADGRTSLYLDIYHNGRRSYEFPNLYQTKGSGSVNKANVQLAQSVGAQRQLELQAGAHGLGHTIKGGGDFVAYVAGLCETKPAAGGSSWKALLHKLREYAPHGATFAGINAAWLEGLHQHLTRSVAQSTARTYYDKVKTALNQAVRDGIIAANPCARVQNIRMPETQRTYLTAEELAALAATSCTSAETKRAFLFACFTGLRISDVRRLRWESIRRGRIEFRQQKTDGVEYLPLSATALQLLGEPAPSGGLVFALLCDVQINRVLRQWAAAAGITKHLSFHCARHTFATLLLTNDVDIYRVSKLLGHKSVQVTQRYAKIVDKRMQEAVERLPGLEV